MNAGKTKSSRWWMSGAREWQWQISRPILPLRFSSSLSLSLGKREREKKLYAIQFRVSVTAERNNTSTTTTSSCWKTGIKAAGEKRPAVPQRSSLFNFISFSFLPSFSLCFVPKSCSTSFILSFFFPFFSLSILRSNPAKTARETLRTSSSRTIDDCVCARFVCIILRFVINWYYSLFLSLSLGYSRRTVEGATDDQADAHCPFFLPFLPEREKIWNSNLEAVTYKRVGGHHPWEKFFARVLQPPRRFLKNPFYLVSHSGSRRIAQVLSETTSTRTNGYPVTTGRLVAKEIFLMKSNQADENSRATRYPLVVWSSWAIKRRRQAVDGTWVENIVRPVTSHGHLLQHTHTQKKENNSLLLFLFKSFSTPSAVY